MKVSICTFIKVARCESQGPLPTPKCSRRSILQFTPESVCSRCQRLTKAFSRKFPSTCDILPSSTGLLPQFSPSQTPSSVALWCNRPIPAQQGGGTRPVVSLDRTSGAPGQQRKGSSPRLVQCLAVLPQPWTRWLPITAMRILGRECLLRITKDRVGSRPIMQPPSPTIIMNGTAPLTLLMTRRPR